MPIVSTFFGIVIRMFYREHGVPHFHAEYQGQQATSLSTAASWPVLFGPPPTAVRLIAEWAASHRGELEANWHRVKAGEPLEKIEPLD